MPTRPPRPCKTPRCSGRALPGCSHCAACRPAAEARFAADRAEFDASRGSAASRGYGATWSKNARAFRARFPISPGYLTITGYWTPNLALQFHTLRCLAAERSEFTGFFRPGGPGARFLEEFPIYEFHPSRVPEPGQQVDHIRPVNGPGDPLFYAEWNWQAISHGQHSEKTATNDGGFRGAPRKKGAA